MRKAILATGAVLVVALTAILVGPGTESRATAAPAPAATSWSYDATYIEACSCHLFCPCYFNNHAEHPYCEFNMAIKVNDGKVGDVSFKGARFWLTGDLGDEWGTAGKSPWLVVTFDPKVPKEQRDAILKVLPKLYPTNFGKVEVDESAFTWEIGQGTARAKLANGKGEMDLEMFKGIDGGKAVLNNVRYFGANNNDGFEMYKSKVHRYDGFGHKFEYSGRNAFVIRVKSGGTL